jgi:outer membrane murein-binding lipoprotein Lpp
VAKDALTLMQERADRVLATRIAQGHWGDIGVAEINQMAADVVTLAATVKLLTMPENALCQILDEAKG